MLSFEPLTEADFPLLLSWLTEPHVKAWWDDGDDTVEKVAQHYSVETGTQRFLIIYRSSESSPAEPIGYIQSYVADEGGIGIDLFLGEARFLNRGIGTPVLRVFLQRILQQQSPAYFVIDPDPANARAIRCYEKVGFRHYATVTTEEGKPAYMMRLMCEHLSSVETERLHLRPMRVEDTNDLLAIFSDPKVMASFGVASFTREQMERWVQRNLDHQAQYGYGLFAVILKSEGVLIGDCGFERMELEGEIVHELGYDFRSDYWNRGYATEAAIAVRDYGFQALGLSQIISLIRVGNGASRRVAEKIGMSLADEIVRYDQSYWKYALERPAT